MRKTAILLTVLLTTVWGYSNLRPKAKNNVDSRVAKLLAKMTQPYPSKSPIPAADPAKKSFSYSSRTSSRQSPLR